MDQNTVGKIRAVLHKLAKCGEYDVVEATEEEYIIIIELANDCNAINSMVQVVNCAIKNDHEKIFKKYFRREKFDSYDVLNGKNEKYFKLMVEHNVDILDVIFGGSVKDVIYCVKQGYRLPTIVTLGISDPEVFIYLFHKQIKVDVGYNSASCEIFI